MRNLLFLLLLTACSGDPPVERPDEEEQQRLDEIEAMLDEQPGNRAD